MSACIICHLLSVHRNIMCICVYRGEYAHYTFSNKNMDSARVVAVRLPPQLPSSLHACPPSSIHHLVHLLPPHPHWQSLSKRVEPSSPRTEETRGRPHVTTWRPYAPYTRRNYMYAPPLSHSRDYMNPMHASMVVFVDTT